MSDTKNNSEQKKEKPKRSLFRKIVNGFITFFVIIFVLLLVFFGYSQTSSFRNFLREEIIEIVNSSTNSGSLYIGDIEGTFLTTLKIYDIALTDSVQTVAYIGEIEIQTSPLQLLLQKIYLRKIHLSDIFVKLEADKNGELNLAKLFASEEKVEEEIVKEESGSSFPFKIQINDFSINNLNFSNKTYEYLNKDVLYETINSNDLQIQNFNLFSRVYADLSKSELRFILENLSFQPNFKNFTLENLKGSFFLTKDFASVEELKLITKNTDFTINARLDSLNLLGGAELQKFEKYPVQLELITPSFNFDDLTSFLDATNFLKGEPSLHLRVQGYFGDLNVEKLDVGFYDTKLKMTGNVKNLHVPENLFLDVKINDSYVNYENVTKLLPALELPDFKNVILSNFNAEYKGEPTKFSSKIFGDVNKGKVDGSLFLDLTKDKLVYDGKLETTNLNLSPVLGFATKLNTKSKVKGEGTSPNDLIADAVINIKNSVFDIYSIKNLDLTTSADSQIIKMNVSSIIENASLTSIAEFNFTDTSKTKYDITADIKKLDLSRLTKDQKDSSNLNLAFSLNGTGLELDEMQNKFIAKLEPSTYNDHEIPESQIDLEISKTDTTRSISLNSDFLDFNIGGDFSLSKAIDLLDYQSEVITRIISDKVDELNLLKEDTLINYTAGLDTSIAKENISFNYNFVFKDFETIAKFLGLKKLDISGAGEGVVKNDDKSFGVTTNFKIDYFVNVFDTSVIYMSDLESKISFSRNNIINDFNNLFGNISFKTDRVYANRNFDDISADFLFNKGKLYFNSGAKLDTNLSFYTDGSMILKPEFNDINLSNLFITYNNQELFNEEPIAVEFTNDSVRVKDFNLSIGSSLLTLDGILHSDGNLNYLMRLEDSTGASLSKLLVKEGDRPINGDLLTEIWLTGNLSDPLIDIKLDLKDINIGGNEFGRIISNIYYEDKLLETDIRFIDTSKTFINPSLKMYGTVPINLAFLSDEERFIKDKEMDLKIVTNEFIINTFGDILPFVKNQMGILNADLSINGTVENPKFTGKVFVDDSYLTLRANNLDYNMAFHASFNNEEITIEDFMIKNTLMVSNHGIMKGKGKAVLSSNGIAEAEFIINGDLTVLSEKTKEVMPNLYGTLFIGTDGDWIYTSKNGKSNFVGEVLVKKANLTFSAGQASGGNLSENIQYVFIEDTTNISDDDLMLRRLLESNNQNKVIKSAENNAADLDYEFGVSIQDPAEIVFILSKAANQKLTVNAAGSMRFERISGQQFIQGEFTVLSGSKLDFIKTFNAEGAIRFESDVTNPYLDIVSTYQSDYYDVQEQTTKPVAVKLKLTGPLSDLGRNLTENTDNINVYVGQRNIQDNVPDSRLDVSDAFSFVLIGKFKNDLSADQRTELGNQINSEIGNVAGSFLGPVLTGFVNSAVGEVVNDIRLGQTQQATTFSISGRIKDVKYTFGGTTDVFQNVSQANVRIEYLFNPNFLMRFERKDPVLQTNSFEEKITEFGLKYRFEF